MSTAVLEREAIQTALPVRLPPWQKNPYGPGNLYDMLKVAAYGFISIGSTIQKLGNVLEQLGDEREAEQEELAQYADLLNFLEISSWNLGIVHTGGIARSIREEQIGKRLRNGQVRQALKEINRSFVQELEKEIFLHVNGPNASLFGKADAFGAKVAKQFASCNADVWAAGNCIAMDRPVLLLPARGIRRAAAQSGGRLDRRGSACSSAHKLRLKWKVVLQYFLCVDHAARNRRRE